MLSLKLVTILSKNIRIKVLHKFLLLATLTRSEGNRERRGAAPFCHRRTTSESFWSRSDSGPHRSA